MAQTREAHAANMLNNEIFNSMTTGLIILNLEANLLVEDLNIAAIEILGLDKAAINSDISKSHPNLYKLLEEIKAKKYEGEKKSKKIELNTNGQYLNAYISKFNGNYLLELTKMVQKDIGKATHELKRPIQNIKTLSETLILGAKDDPANRDKFISNINEEADRMASLVKDMLRLSSLKEGGIEIHREKINVKKSIEKILSSLDSKIKEKNLNLQTSVNENFEINADKELFEHLLQNLIENAIKYNKNDGDLEIKNTEDDFLEIKDTGIGIAEEDLKKIFEQYYRTKLSQNIQGSGIGLSIAKSIVDLHNGKILVNSSPNKGSSFKIQL